MRWGEISAFFPPPVGYIWPTVPDHCLQSFNPNVYIVFWMAKDWANNNHRTWSAPFIWRAGLLYEAPFQPVWCALCFLGSQDHCLWNFAYSAPSPGIPYPIPFQILPVLECPLTRVTLYPHWFFETSFILKFIRNCFFCIIRNCYFVFLTYLPKCILSFLKSENL